MTDQYRNSTMWGRFFVVSATLLLLNGCGIFAGKDNSEPPSPLPKFTPTVSLNTVWSKNIGGDSDNFYLKLTPALVDETVYVSNDKGIVYALDALTGAQRWQHDTNETITGSIGADDTTVLLGLQTGDVIALSAENGTPLWRVHLSSEILVAPQISGDTVIVRSVDGKIFGLESATGETRWVYERDVPVLSLRGNSTPMIVDDEVFIGLDNGKLAVLDLQTGNPKWESRISVIKGRSDVERMVDIDGKLSHDEHSIYVSSYQGNTAGVERYSGDVLWREELSSYVGSAVDYGSLYLVGSNDTLYALNKEIGSTKWKYTGLKQRKLTAPSIINQYVVTGDYEGYVHWFDANEGLPVARTRVGSAPLRAAPLVLNDNLVLIYGSQGQLVALQVPTADE